MNQGKVKRLKLLEFLDSRIFDPVLEAQSDHYFSQREKQMLKDVQEVARYDKDHYHFQLATAEAVKNEFIRETTQQEIGRIARELEDLNLPRIHLFKDQFLQLCRELGV